MRFRSTVSRLRSFAIVVFAWAALYLPWLGSSGYRSEEGHRVMPAVEMLESGDFVVPHVAGQPYLRKPPLINWLVAASFKCTGVRNEWTARLPSAFAALALALALTFVSVGAHSLGNRGSLAAALGGLTSLGMLEKGRMIEIEAVYVALFGIALLCWLAWWRRGRSSWLTWTVPWVFLGLGLLAKGPAHLLFFYAIVAAVLWKSRQLSQLWCRQHLVGLILAAAIFAAWAIPYSIAVDAHRIAGTWSAELSSRVTGAEAIMEDWILNFPLALAYFLPMALLFPFIRFGKMPADQQPIVRGLAWGAFAPAVLVLLLPGGMPRYILPMLVPACCVVGMAVNTGAFEWQLAFGGRHLRVPRRAVLAAAAAIALGGAIIFPLRSATVQKRRPAFDRAALPINSVVPAGETLYAVDPGFQPYLLYVRAKVRYLKSLDDLPLEARYFVVQPDLEQQVARIGKWEPLHPRLIAHTNTFRGQETLFYVVAPR